MIRNTNELAKAWDLLHFYTSTMAELGNEPACEARALELKSEIRRYNRAVKRQADIAWTDDYGYVEKVKAPKECIDLEDVEDWFEEHEKIDPPNSQWDCTGQMFTAWYSVVILHGEWWVYHRIVCDC